jgi:hypothetical protein
LRATLFAVALGGLLFCYAKLHAYQASQASLTLGRWLAANTRPEEVVLTNFKYLIPPVAYWDGEFGSHASAVADRIMFHKISDLQELAAVARSLSNELTQVCFLREASQPIESTLVKRLETEATAVVRASLPVPPEGARLFKKARMFVWNLLGSRAPQYAPQFTGVAAKTNSFHVTLYRLPPEFIRESCGNLANLPAAK